MSGCQSLKLVRQVMDNESWIKRVLSGANVQTPWQGNPQTWFLTTLVSARDHISTVWGIFGLSFNQFIWTEHLMKASTMLAWFCAFSCTNRPHGAGESSNGCAASAPHQVSQFVQGLWARWISCRYLILLWQTPNWLYSGLLDSSLINSRLVLFRRDLWYLAVTPVFVPVVIENIVIENITLRICWTRVLGSTSGTVDGGNRLGVTPIEAPVCEWVPVQDSSEI
jgi:hypothetical protein